MFKKSFSRLPNLIIIAAICAYVLYCPRTLVPPPREIASFQLPQGKVSFLHIAPESSESDSSSLSRNRSHSLYVESTSERGVDQKFIGWIKKDIWNLKISLHHVELDSESFCYFVEVSHPDHVIALIDPSATIIQPENQSLSQEEVRTQ